MDNGNHTVISAGYCEGEVLVKMFKPGWERSTRLHQTMTSSEAIVFATNILDVCRQIADNK